MAARHFFNLETVQPQKSFAGGSRTALSNHDVLSFFNISIARLKLKPGYAQEPLWHPNAHKIGYCTQGSCVITILSPDFRDTFTVETNEMFFVPQGHFHHIVCRGTTECHIVFALSSEKPDEMFFTKSLTTLPESVFASTFHTPAPFFDALKKNQNDTFITPCAIKNTPIATNSKYKLSVGSSSPLLTTAGGYLKAATKSYLPVLNNLGVLTFGLNPQGIVEPHWHPNAGELIYITKGRAKISILDPDGNVDIVEATSGQGGFAPAGHFHSIENIGSENVEVIAFFNNADPDYIGAAECASVLSKEALASAFNLPPEHFAHFEPSAGPIVIGAPARELAHI